MPAQILNPTPENLGIAAQALRRGEVVAMPTETVYGLAGCALDSLALARIFETKERPTFDPLIVHVGFSCNRISELERQKLVDGSKLSLKARELADRLMQRFWPGPLTLVLPKHENVPDLATSGLPSVALRMPRHSVAQALIAAAGMPLAAPSANRFGRISPTSAEDVLAELRERIDWIIDGGRCEIGVESTIIAVSDSGELTLLRPGGLPVEEIEKAASERIIRVASGSMEGKAQQAPGMLESHYAPTKRLLLLPAPLQELKSLPAEWMLPPNVALLTVLSPAKTAAARFTEIGGRANQCVSLSESGDLSEAARNLFRTLRFLDSSDASLIVSEPCPVDSGLGYAIGDRLKRASAIKLPS